MRAWPPISDPELLARLALDDAGFAAYVREVGARLGRRAFEPAYLAHALGYPWARPAWSYVLRDGAVEPAKAIDRELVAAFVADRHPLVAFGSNGAPARLAAKLEHLPEPADRTVLVLTGDLHGVDVCAQASPSILGTLPAALVASPPAAVRAAVLWLTAAQVTQLTWTEVGYRLGRLDRARFVADDADLAVDDLFAYISRAGALRLDGAPVALAAIPATGRTAPARTQEAVLDAVAALALGGGARAEDLVRLVFEDYAGAVAAVAAHTWPTAIRLPADDWTPYPA